MYAQEGKTVCFFQDEALNYKPHPVKKPPKNIETLVKMIEMAVVAISSNDKEYQSSCNGKKKHTGIYSAWIIHPVGSNLTASHIQFLQRGYQVFLFYLYGQISV